MNQDKIRKSIIIEEGKPEIDLTNWLNMATNMPEMWQNLINEALTNRYGVFNYNYADVRSKEKDGELIYVKPYSIDLKISIGKTLNELDGDEYIELNQLSKEQMERFRKLTKIFKSFEEYFLNGTIDVEKVKKGLDEL